MDLSRIHLDERDNASMKDKNWKIAYIGVLSIL